MNSKFFNPFYIKVFLLAIFYTAALISIPSIGVNTVKAATSCPSNLPKLAIEYTDYLLCCDNDVKVCNRVYKDGSYQSNAQSDDTIAKSANLKTATPEEITALKAALSSDNNSCPEPIKQRYLDILDTSGGELYVQGTSIVAYDNGSPVVMTCASASTFNKLVIRGIMILFSLVGLALAFAVGRAAFLMITSFANSDQWETGLKSLIISVMYTVGLIFFYTIFIFVAVDVLGIGVIRDPSTPKEFNLFCSNRIIINITFDQNGNC